MKRKPISASAPGKLMICGEYAVLDHAPAIVTAVNVRAHCKFEPGGTQLRISARPLRNDIVTVEISDQLDWGDEPLELLAAAFYSLPKERQAQLSGLAGELLLDTSSFHVKETKLGLGSSAAALTALMGVFWQLTGGLPAEAEAFEQLRVAHTRFQGNGSGADLAASLVGGTLLFRRDPAIRAPVSLPSGLAMIPVWTREAASTGDFLARLAEFEKSSHDEFLARFKVLEIEAEEAALAAADGDAGRLLEALGDFGAAMNALGEAAGIPIWSAAHREIASIARSAGASYKPSGAGGGDVGLVFMLAEGDAGRLDEVKSALSSAGYPEMPLVFGARGLRIEA